MKSVLARQLVTGLGIVLTAGMANGYVAIVNKADHTEMHVVPAPGAVTTSSGPCRVGLA